MKTNNKITHSRSRTPWDGKDDRELSELELFIRDEYKSHYKEHHPELAAENEAAFLNSIRLAECKYCDSKQIKLKGFDKNGIQRYQCYHCGKTFTVLTNTIFENHKIPLSEWIEYLLNLFGYASNNLNSKTNKNSPTTSKYWMAKVFLVLQEYQNDITLDGNVYIDETYHSVVASEVVYKDGKKLRGISRNKICIATGTDGNKSFFILAGRGKLTKNKAMAAYVPHITAGSYLIHDNENSHIRIIEELHLNHIVYNSKEIKKLPDKDNPLRTINNLHSLLKKFLRSHSGFNREELQGYLNLFAFIVNGPENKLEKVELFLKMALLGKQKLQYRVYYSK